MARGYIVGAAEEWGHKGLTHQVFCKGCGRSSWVGVDTAPNAEDLWRLRGTRGKVIGLDVLHNRLVRCGLRRNAQGNSRPHACGSFCTFPEVSICADYLGEHPEYVPVELRTLVSWFAGHDGSKPAHAFVGSPAALRVALRYAWEAVGQVGDATGRELLLGICRRPEGVTDTERDFLEMIRAADELERAADSPDNRIVATRMRYIALSKIPDYP